ncbi:MAG: hydrogenase maturation protease [Sediminibacterium sp.]
MEIEKTKTAIMGFGNPCRSDDAVGIYVIEELKKALPNDTNITLFDMGTSAFEVLFNLKGHQRIIIIDAVVNSGENDGAIFKLPASEINAIVQDDPMVFLHSLKWDQALSYAKKMLREEYPEDISVYLVAVTDTRLEMKMSEVVREAGNKVVQHITDDLKLSVPANAII